MKLNNYPILKIFIVYISLLIIVLSLLKGIESLEKYHLISDATFSFVLLFLVHTLLFRAIKKEVNSHFSNYESCHNIEIIKKRIVYFFEFPFGMKTHSGGQTFLVTYLDNSGNVIKKWFKLKNNNFIVKDYKKKS